MLASITPLGERGRQSSWGVTVGAFLIGASAAGLAAGALAGALGGLVLPGSVGPRPRLIVLASALAVAIALDSRPGGAPGPRRQVDERWLDEFRGWVYGAGFGAQLGLGITTVVSSAATYVALLSAFLTGEVGLGALVLGCFGMIRGLTPLLAARVRRPEELIEFHRRFERRGRPVRGLGRVVMGALLAFAAAGALG